MSKLTRTPITDQTRIDNSITPEILHEQFTALAENFNLATEVFSSGPIESRIAIVGEGPGETEVRHPKRLPFVGGAGNLLWDALRKYGLDRTNTYTTNVVKRQISLSRKGNERHAVHRDELDRWISLVQWELAQLPNVEIILVLGNYALEAVAEEDGITKWRGSVLDATLPNGKSGKLVCTVNPAYAMRELSYEPIFRMDCQKLDLVNRKVFKPHHIEKIINPTFKEALAYIRDLKKAKRPVSYDIEAMNKELACIGLSNNPHQAMCVNFRDLVKNRFTLSQEVDILYAVQDLCDSHQMIAQNAQFDSYFSRMHQWLRIHFWFDTLLAHHDLYPRLPHTLAFLTAQYTTHPFYKDDGDQWREGGDIDSYWEYNCCDAAITYAVYEKLNRELHAQGRTDFFFNHTMRAQPHLVSATVHGVDVDASVKEVILGLVNSDVESAHTEFQRLAQEATGEDDYRPNPGSWQQMQTLLFDKLGLVGRGRSTDEENRKEILKNPRTPPLCKELIAALDRFKEEDKFRGTYANSRESPDGRFRCEYKQFGVSKAPGRLSSSKLLVEEDGGNMQNQPVRARGKFIADPGCFLCYFDLAQAEAQVVGFRADIPKWKAQFAQARKDGKYDCHRALASDMFKVKYELVPVADWDENGKPTIRYVAKRCRHGLNYRMQQYRLSQVTGLPFHTATRAFSLYHFITPELRPWWEEEEKQFRETREVHNALGRRLKVIQRIDETVLESLIAFYPQSTIGDKITQTWYQCEEDDDWPMDARIAIDVHDNLVAIATPKVAKTVLKIMKKYAESTIWIQDVYKRRKPEPLSISAELKISYPSSWSDEAIKQKDGSYKPGFVRDDKNGLHRWSEMEKVHL